MPFIRKVRVLFKTRLIFPRINGPNDTSNKKPKRCFFTCEKNDTYAPKLPPFIGACSLQRHFADIQREKFFSKCFSRKKCEKYLGNRSGIVLLVLLSRKNTVESRKNNGGRGKTEGRRKLKLCFLSELLCLLFLKA